MTTNTSVYRDIDEYLEEIYDHSVALAVEIKASGLDAKSQLRGFETLINATTRFSEILNYIKNQAGKESRDNKWRTVAPSMLEQLDRLEMKAKELAGGDARLLMEVKLRLARGWAKQVVCHFLYQRNEQARGGTHGTA